MTDGIKTTPRVLFNDGGVNHSEDIEATKSSRGVQILSLKGVICRLTGNMHFREYGCPKNKTVWVLLRIKVDNILTGLG